MAEQQTHLFCGVHVFGELYGISPDKLNNLSLLEQAMNDGIRLSGASLCSMQSKVFEPEGLTLLALLSESHASIHTYPQEGALFFDAFTCGTECRPEQIAEALIKALEPSRSDLRSIPRGQMPGDMSGRFATAGAETSAIFAAE